MEPISDLAASVGKITSGLFIITAVSGATKEGYLGSWIQQVSFSPLMVGIAIRPGRPCYDLIKTTGRFCINIVGQKNNGLMKPFWSPKPEQDAFAGLGWRTTARGYIALDDAMAAIECEVRSSVTPGDHEIVFGEAVAGIVIQAEDKPLSHTRKSGSSY